VNSYLALKRFFLDAQMANFLRGHVGAFEAWGGLPRTLLYDNLKSALLERQGDAIRFHPTLLALAAHDRFEPRPVAVARGNEKGRVERAIRSIREGVFAARTWRDLEDLNGQAKVWCQGQAADRPCPEDRSVSVRTAFAQERPSLLAFPDNPFPTEEQVAVRAGKTPSVRFDRNDYSIPHTYVQRTLSVRASLSDVRVLDGSIVIATHPRHYDVGQQIEDPAHLAALVERKRKARQHRGQDRLAQAVPNSRTLDEALVRAVPHPNAVRLALERRRAQREQPPPLAVALPPDPRLRDLVVRPHALNDYDQLHGQEIAHDDHQP